MRRVLIPGLVVGMVAVVVVAFGPDALAVRGEARHVRLGELRARLDLSRQTLHELRATVQQTREALDRVTSQRDVALRQRQEMRAIAASARREARDWRTTTQLMAAILLGAFAAMVIRRRHTVRVRIPDSPADLFVPADDRVDRSG